MFRCCKMTKQAEVSDINDSNICKQADVVMDKFIVMLRDFGNIPQKQCSDMIDDIEKEIFKLPQLSGDSYKLEEAYADGMYCRKINMLRGAIVTGRAYKRDHIEMMLSGDITVLSVSGKKRRYRGYNLIPAHRGKRQILFVHEETVWLTVTRVPDDIKIADMLDYSAFVTIKEYEDFVIHSDRIDYQNFLLEINMKQEDIDKLLNIDDVVGMPSEYSHMYTGESRLSGIGLFTKDTIKKGSIICPARVGENRTIAGRYSNHSTDPNSLPSKIDGLYYFVANRDIEEEEEVTCNYREILNFRKLTMTYKPSKNEEV